MLRILERQSTQSASSIQLCASHKPFHIKKTAALCLISFKYIFFCLIEPFGVCAEKMLE